MKKLLVSAIMLLSFVAVSALAAPLSDTGQTKCYDNSTEIPCPQPDEPFYGQDAQYGPNLHSYTDLGNGIVRDNVTGLEWAQSSSGALEWYPFSSYCSNLSLGGHNDWRKPTIRELLTLVDRGRYNPSYHPLFPPFLFEVWTDTYEGGIGGLGAYFIVDFSNGTENYGDAYYGIHQGRAVRSGQPAPPNRFIDNEDDTISDTYTRLMWQQATGPGDYTWEQALNYCDNLTLAGHSDWRMPNINELESIIDYSFYYPEIKIDTTYFPDTTGGYDYWSSSTDNHSPHKAWTISFNGGMWHQSRKTSTSYVRAVRGGQCEFFGDSDGDVLCDDGDYSGTAGDNPCRGGKTDNCDDNCPENCNSNQLDADNDTIGDVCDPDPGCGGCGQPTCEQICFIDSDSDSIPDETDNCPNIYNPGQEDDDGDGTGNICDNNTFSECSIIWGANSVPTNEVSRSMQATYEAFVAIFGTTPVDCGLCDGSYGCFDDWDCLYGSHKLVLQNGVWLDDSGPHLWDVVCIADNDNDGIPNTSDNCPDICNSNQLDADTDGNGDVCDPSPGCGGCGQPTCEIECIP